MKESYSPNSTVVLTTHERKGYFSSVLGEDIDVRFDPWREPRLDDLLNNVALSGGRLVVIDEDFFPDVDDMVAGLERFTDSSSMFAQLDFIVVCSQRSAGDELLAHLVAYCQIFDIIYGKRGPDISIALKSILDHPNSRLQVAEIVKCMRWNECSGSRASAEKKSLEDEIANSVLSLTISFGNHSVQHDLVLNPDCSSKAQIQLSFELRRGTRAENKFA